MRRTGLIVAVLLMVISSMPAAAAAPAAGKGGKYVEAFSTGDAPIPINCANAAELALHIDGWFQYREFRGAGNKNLDLAVYHIDLAYENEDGTMFVFRDRGPDHAYIDRDGNFVLTITGRSSFSGVIGHVIVVNDDFDGAIIRGNQLFDAPFDFTGEKLDELACAALS